MPVIDTHIHLFDPTRASGVPWPKPDDEVLYKPALPERYRQVSKGFGVVGAIAIEASPLLEDNDWLLGVAEKDPMIVGIIGDLVPGCATFGAALERLHRTPLFLGLRYGNLWDRNLTADIGKPGFIDGLRLLSDAKLVFESANPTPELIQTLADLAEKIPELTIVVDHLPHGTIPAGDSAKNIYLRNLAGLGGSRRVFIKLSEILHEKDGGVVTDLEAYQGVLDELADIRRRQSHVWKRLAEQRPSCALCRDDSTSPKVCSEERLGGSGEILLAKFSQGVWLEASISCSKSSHPVVKESLDYG